MRTSLLLLAVFVLISICMTAEIQVRQKKAILSGSPANAGRPVKQQPGFFWLLGSLLFEQIRDTRKTIQDVQTMLNSQFVEEGTTTTAAPVNGTTKKPQYRLTRREFNNILLRNLRGISRLYDKELQLAIKQSEQNRRDFNKELRTSIAKQLA